MRAAVQEPPGASGIDLANWYWKVVRRFALERFGIGLSRSSCVNWLHRLGFAFKRPKKRLLKADEAKREAFVAEYAALREEAGRKEARIFFADEAHFRADAELRGKWVLKGKPALVDSTSPRYGEKASYYSAVCLETGEVEWMELEGNSNSGTSVAFLEQLRERHPGPMRVTCFGGLDQPAVWREGQLLFGGVPGDGRGGMDGTGGQQQQWDLGCLPGTTERKASGADAGHLGQRAGPSWRGDAGVPQDAWAGLAVGEPAGLQPGLQRR